MRLIICLTLLGLFSQPALAQRLWWRPLPLRSSITQLSVGQSMVGIHTSYRKIKESFADDGSLQPLGELYEKKQKWGQLAGDQSIREFAEKNQVDPSEVATLTSFEVSRDEEYFSPYWAFALTENWWVSAELPIIRSRTAIRTQVSSSESYVRYMKQSGRLLKSQGDQGVTEVRRTDIGDIALSSQFQAYESADMGFSFFSNATDTRL